MTDEEWEKYESKFIDFHKECEICKLGFKPYFRITSKIYNHHLNGSIKDEFNNKSGRTIKLCSYHHGRIHSYINSEVFRIAFEHNPNFGEEAFKKLIENKGR